MYIRKQSVLGASCVCVIFTHVRACMIERRRPMCDADFTAPEREIRLGTFERRVRTADPCRPPCEDLVRSRAGADLELL